MDIYIKCSPKEIAALARELQERQGAEAAFVPETSEGPCRGTGKVAATASSEDNPKHPS